MEQDIYKSLNVLYVDDELDNLLVFRSAFRRYYNIFTANSAEEGFEILKNNDIALIITDQRMPGMTGVQFLQHIADEPVKIRMILTGFSDIEAVIDAINTGKVYRYITKPWDKEELKITIDRAIEALLLIKKNKTLIEELEEANEHLEEKVAQRTAEVNKQKEEIENLLLNIFPKEVAEELKVHSKSKAKRFEETTVMFLDIEDFTRIAESMSPEAVVDSLDRCFSKFDEIVSKHKLEKIKTIGDAYLCVGGLPVEGEARAEHVVTAAMEMLDAMEKMKIEMPEMSIFNFRIGIHTGPVVAGVVGAKKFAYDIWGDTVNTAARLEESSVTGKINISSSTYELIKDHFICNYRGKISAKNKGEIDMYFVEVPIRKA
ncbi:MAG: response regulator [Bacteroidetes bacterium]|nr:response regulator [Bacteroidota bacterium]